MEVYGPLHMHRTSTDVQVIDVERSGMALTVPHRARIVLHPCTCMRLSRAVDAAQCACGPSTVAANMVPSSLARFYGHFTTRLSLFS